MLGRFALRDGLTLFLFVFAFDSSGASLDAAEQKEGDYFRAEWLPPYDKMPARETLKIYGASDYAVTADGGDYTVHIVVCI
jgi:hypothetical protein